MDAWRRAGYDKLKAVVALDCYPSTGSAVRPDWNPANFYLPKRPHSAQPFDVRLRTQGRPRSLNQNRWSWPTASQNGSLTERSSHMRKLLAIAGLVLLVTDYSLAQSGPDPAQCEQVRQAVAQYGYKEARRHAMANYGPQAVEAGDKCLTKRDRFRNKSVTSKPRPLT